MFLYSNNLNNSVINTNKMDDAYEITDQQFEDYLKEAYLNFDFHRILLLLHLNKNYIIDYEFHDPEVEEMLYNLNYEKGEDNDAFLGAKADVIYGMSLKSISNLRGISIQDISELLVLKGYFTAQLFIANKFLMDGAHEETRISEEAKIFLMIYATVDLKNMRVPTDEQAKWFSVYVDNSGIQKGIFDNLRYEDAKVVYCKIIDGLFLGKYFDYEAMSNVLMMILGKREVSTFKELYLKYRDTCQYTMTLFDFALSKFSDVEIARDALEAADAFKTGFWDFIKDTANQFQEPMPTKDPCKYLKSVIKKCEPEYRMFYKTMIDEYNMYLSVEKRVYNAIGKRK